MKTDKNRRDRLKLRQMEMSLVRAQLAHTGLMTEADYQSLRYLLNFARLDTFSPGAAVKRQGRADVQLSPDIMQPLRAQLLNKLFRILRRGTDQQRRLTASAELLPELLAMLSEAQAKILKRHADDFSREELEAEVCYKVLVVAAGGGGGAGYVYIGAFARLQAMGVLPAYMVGTSIGALLGAFYAREENADLDALLSWAKTLQTRDIFATTKIARTYSLPGLMRLHLRAFHQQLQHPDGTPLRLSDLPIPYEAVIGGLRRKMYERLPAALRQLEKPAHSSRRFSVQLAERMVQLSLYATPHLVKGIPLGRDPATRDIRVVDALGISAAIPGVLQYEPPMRDSKSNAALQALMLEHDLVSMVDGGVVDNVPARTAWEGVESGRLGTRNAFYLALDCFHPRFDPKHAWLLPVTTAVQLQQPANRNYHDWLIRFEPTLSPVNLIPHTDDFDRSWQWGELQMDAVMPYVSAAMKPIEWRLPAA
ncbi:MAG: patatin-like phospholipase family protein [Nevskiales bacterium]